MAGAIMMPKADSATARTIRRIFCSPPSVPNGFWRKNLKWHSVSWPRGFPRWGRRIMWWGGQLSLPADGNSITTAPSTLTRLPIPREILRKASRAFSLPPCPSSARLLRPKLAASNKAPASAKVRIRACYRRASRCLPCSSPDHPIVQNKNGGRNTIPQLSRRMV